MKILVAGPTRTDGLRQATGLRLQGAPEGTAQTPLASLVAELLRLQHQVQVLTLDAEITAPVSYTEAGLSVTFCPLRAPPRYRTRVRAFDLFAKEIEFLEGSIRALNPDIVHAHWTYEYAEAAVRSGYPHLVTMHDLGWEYFFQFRDPYRFARLVMKYRVMPRIRELTVVAPFMQASPRQYGYFKPVHVVPNPLTVPPLTRLKTKKSQDIPRIVSIGNRSRIKNIRMSIEAFEMINEYYPNAELHLFGPGLDREFASNSSSIFGHDQTPYPELMQFLETSATLLIHPSLLETFGMIIAEAKLRGLPVIAGESSGGVPWVCGNNAGCKLVDVTSAASIADAALSFLGDRERYSEAARQGRADIVDRFDVRKITQMYLEHYSRIAS